MKRTLLLTALSGILYLTITGYASGPGQISLDGTGSPGANSSCVSCHSGGAGITTGTVEIRKLSTGLSGPIVTSYMPDTNYIIRVVGNNANLTHFGFQLTALNSTNVSAGTFSNLPGNVHTATVSSKAIVEHAVPIAKTNNQYEVTFNWIAPAAGSGSVTFYGIINAVNNGGQVNGDKPGNQFTKVLTETTPTGVGQLSADIKITAYPNPVTDKLNISIENAETGMYSIRAFDINGREIATQATKVDGKYNTAINTSTWAAGIYHVKIAKGTESKTITITK